MRELHSAAADPWVFQLRDAQDVVIRDVGSRLVDESLVDQNAPGHDERLRPGARLYQAAIDQGDIEARFTASSLGRSGARSVARLFHRSSRADRGSHQGG